MVDKTFVCVLSGAGRGINYGLIKISDGSIILLDDMPAGFSREYIGSYKTDAFFAVFFISDDRLKVFKKLVVYSTATDKWITRIDDADALVNGATGREDLVADFTHSTGHRFKLYTYYGEHRLGIPVKLPEGGRLLVSLSTETWQVVDIAIPPRSFHVVRDDWFIYEGDVFLKTDTQNPIASFTEADKIIGVSKDSSTMVFDKDGNYPDWLHTFIVCNTDDWSYNTYKTELSNSALYSQKPTAEMLYFLNDNKIFNRRGELVKTLGFDTGTWPLIHYDSDTVISIDTDRPSTVSLYKIPSGELLSTSVFDFYVQAEGSGPDIGGGGEVAAKNFWTDFTRAVEVI